MDKIIRTVLLIQAGSAVVVLYDTEHFQTPWFVRVVGGVVEGAFPVFLPAVLSVMVFYRLFYVLGLSGIYQVVPVAALNRGWMLGMTRLRKTFEKLVGLTDDPRRARRIAKDGLEGVARDIQRAIEEARAAARGTAKA